MNNIDSDELLRGLNHVNDSLLALAEPIEIEEAIKRESQICAEARMLGIPFDIDDNDRFKKGMALAALEQQCRIKRSGIVYIGKSLTVIYSIPTQNSDITTEMILDYTDSGSLKKAYTRTADRKGNRWSIQISHGDAMKLEKLFGLKEVSGARPEIAQRMSQ